ncbi:acyltransferase [Acuticoccus sp. M5D2P5]|uniref:acyltransferase n=1 Tax=Acuticoccus kalidii TaxID=2910977 RepID=UPI001F18C0AE|nr:acyltransferase [Acuticoccus kalidii]MCF3936669.1 acyltransferase [Acuticoccus kalidii]
MSRAVEPLSYFSFIRETAHNAHPITFQHWYQQFVRGVNCGPYWPVDATSKVFNWRNVYVGVDSAPGYNRGCYVQAFGPVSIGDYTNIAQNVGLISANHDVFDGRVHRVGSIDIGRYCWIGMGAIVLPGVELGDFTTVGAGAVVTRSVPEGHAMIAGNPARVIRRLDPDACVRYEVEHKYHGYIKEMDFAAFRERALNPRCDR